MVRCLQQQKTFSMDGRQAGQSLSRITVNVSMDDLHRNRSFLSYNMQLTNRTMTTVSAYPAVRSGVRVYIGFFSLIFRFNFLAFS